MVWYVLEWLYSIYVSSIFIPSNDIFHPFARSKVLYYTLHSEFHDYAYVVPVGFVFVPAVPFVLRIPILVASVMAFHVVGASVIFLWRRCCEMNFQSL